MDLNHLYHQHQLSTMRADAAPCRTTRTRHLAVAGTFANRIRSYQLALGADASAGWPAAVATGCAQS